MVHHLCEKKNVLNILVIKKNIERNIDLTTKEKDTYRTVDKIIFVVI